MRFRWRLLGVTLTRDARPAWIAVGGILLTSVVGGSVSWILSTDASAAIRYAGALLQIGGLGTVALGLSRTRRLFPGRSSTGDRILAWFKRVGSAFRGPRVIEARGNIVTDGATVRGKGGVRLSVPSDASLEQRIQVLAGNLERLEKELDAEIRDVTQKIDGVVADLRGERNERQQEDATTVRLIEDTAVGGIGLEIVGMIWLIVGVLGTGFPDEAATLIGFVR